mgnify:CR=1 FL=1
MEWALLAISLLTSGALAVAWQRSRRAQQRWERHTLEQSRRSADLERQVGRYAALFQNAPDGFFVLGEDYRFVEVNPAFCRLLGYTADELRQMKMTDLEVSSQSPEGLAAGQWRTGRHYFATVHRHKDGHTVYLESSVVVLSDGQRKQLVGLAREVTERLRSEQALRKSEAQYRNLVETSRDLIWSLDLDGRWTFVNNAARTIYGYDPEEMIGRSIADFAHPDQRARTLEILDEIRAGKPRFRFETQHLRKDGTPVHLSISVIPIRDEGGQVVACTGTSTDITYRRQAEQRLREAHDRFASLVARMPLGYIVWSPEFRVLEWNPAATSIFGYPPEQALGQSAADLLVSDEGRAGFTEMTQRALRGEPCSGTLLVNRRQGGEKIKCEWHCTPLPDAHGRIQGVVTLVRDVSERERLEAQLRQSQKLESLGVLAGGVAHDFNNLLVGIMGNASLAMEQLPAHSPLRPLLERVVNAGRRATDLTQRMLAYAGRATCDVQLMDLNALVREMVDFAAAAIPKNVALHIDAQPDLPLLRADSGQLQQVVMNLLINAAEAIGEAVGEVRVATWSETLDAKRIAAEFADHELQPGLYVVLEVRDTGCGMTPEVQSRIFDPFFTTKFAGRGLGLSAILGIVRAHRGAITVSSQVGVGTVFRVLFPAVAGRTKVVAPPAKTPTLPRGATVLVIDDEADIRDVVEAVLSRRGVKVLTAADGQQALELFRRQADDIDVVLLDMNMPGLSGEAVFRALREIRPDVRVVLSTGYSEQEAALRFAGVPLAGFVHKPYTATALVEKIGAAIAG